MIIHSIDKDLVINGTFLTGKVDYKYALENLYPLIDRLNIQRKIQIAKFYKRLEKDLVIGCIMPPITIAFVTDLERFPTNKKDIQVFVEKNISKAFILDGIQRLNTLHRTHKKYNDNLFGSELNLERPLFVNVIVCDSMDNLLYRMITLNNGQKPMSARHQIEILADNVYDFTDTGVTIVSEKDNAILEIRGAFKKADFIKAYLAFLSSSVSIDNKKIIEEKLDELVANKILESSITYDGLEFFEIIQLIGRLSKLNTNNKWFSNGNNLIGFAVGVRESFNEVKLLSAKQFQDHIEIIEGAISSLKMSSIKLSRERRRITSHFFEEFSKTSSMNSMEFLDELLQNVL